MRRVAPVWVALACALTLLGCESIPDAVRVPKPRPAPTGPRAEFSAEPEVRVRVRTAQARLQVDGVPRVTLRPVTADPALRAVQVPAPVTIASGSEGLRFVDASQAPHIFPFGTDVEVAAVGEGGRPEGALRVGQTRYPGFLTLRPNWHQSPSEFDVTVTMPVETYLPGVLTHELLKDWPRQTNECQAVAARTYVLHERARARAESRPYDVEDSTQDQVYGGLTGLRTPNEAVAATRGLLLAHEGRLLRAYYSSTCGGRPNSASRVWPTGPGYEFNLLPPLQGKPRPHACQQARLYRWEVTRTADDASRRLRAWGKAARHDVQSLTRLRAVEVDQRNDAQRPVVFRLTDDRGSDYRLTSEELRNALNHPVQGLPPITGENRVNSGDVDVEVSATHVRLQGRGWGHGVGMCQWCAKGMADAGLDWRAMVKDFYPGAEVVKAY
jgi:stage II sporulation protein D